MRIGTSGFDPDKINEINAWVTKQPKTQLHLHLEGSIPFNCLYSLSQKYQDSSDHQYRSYHSFACNNFSDIRSAYQWISSLLRSPEDLEFAITALAHQLKNQGVVYAEITVTPFVHINNGWQVDDFLLALQQGCIQAELAGGPKISWIFDFPRNIAKAEKSTLDIALIGKDFGVIGLGLAGLENGFPPSMYKDTFQTARSNGLLCLIHAGETTEPDYIWEAINELHAFRIGHGFSAIKDPLLVKHLANSQIPLEICPTSNFQMGLVKKKQDHPIRDYWDRGVFCTLNSDDDLLFSTDIVQEYLFVIQHCSFSLAEIKQLIQNGFNASSILSLN